MSFSNKVSTRTRTLLTTMSSLIIAIGLMAPSVSQASASGCTGGNPNYGPHSYCVTLSGSGTYVDHITGIWRGSAWACNAYMTAEFFDTNWRWYQTYRTPVQNGCGTGGDATVWVYANKRYGYMCSTLHYSYNNRGSGQTMSVCHQIK